MTITRQQVADLREGDVVELRFPSGSVIRGPLTDGEHYGPGLGIAHVGWGVRDRDGEPGFFTREGATLTVVSRAPRPLYVNHPRAEPVPGDVVRDADDEDSKRTWCTDDDGRLCWQRLDDGEANFYSRDDLPARLRLLVDGETGQVVP